MSRPGDQAAAEEPLQEPSPPAWREVEVSIEGDATRGRIDRCNHNSLVIPDLERLPDVESEPTRRLHVQDVERDMKNAGSKKEVVARA